MDTRTRALDVIRTLSDSEVVRDLDALAEQDRHVKASVVAHLVVIKERSIHLDMGYLRGSRGLCPRGCVDRLGCSKDTAYKRSAAVKVATAHPEVIEWLARREMTLSGLLPLAPHTGDAELVAQARGKSKRQIQQLVAEAHPDADWNRFQSRVRPVAEGVSKLEVTVPNELVALIDEALDIDSHVNPGRSVPELLSRALGVYVERRKRERFAQTDRPRPASDRPTERVPAATVRAAYERSAGQCEYVSPEGRRCRATAFLESDHAIPQALGGGHDRIRIYCRDHNQRAADIELGQAHMDKARRRASLTREVKAALARLGFSASIAAPAARGAVDRLGADAKLEPLLKDALSRASAAHRAISNAREPIPTWPAQATRRPNVRRGEGHARSAQRAQHPAPPLPRPLACALAIVSAAAGSSHRAVSARGDGRRPDISRT